MSVIKPAIVLISQTDRESRRASPVMSLRCTLDCERPLVHAVDLGNQNGTRAPDRRRTQTDSCAIPQNCTAYLPSRAVPGI
jgi:hypothetical protein